MPRDPVLEAHYADGTCAWWHLSRPSPELVAALADGWIRAGGRAVDLGCGLATEAAHLAGLGFAAVGVDLSATALRRAGQAHPLLLLVRADVLRLPFADARFDVALDRGTFHCLPPTERRRYAAEVARVLRPAGGGRCAPACGLPGPATTSPPSWSARCSPAGGWRGWTRC